MLSLITELTNWITTLPEPAGLLLLGAALISMTSWLRRVPAADLDRTPKVVRRRIPSATRLAAQRGHS
jgi:hypothetical protein